MPRNRQPQTRFANRTDLTAAPAAGTAPPPPQPMAVAKGQPYGEAGAQQAALRALPLPDNRAAQQNQIANTVGQATAPLAPAPYEGSQVQAEAQAFQPPPLTPIGAPSERPGEHIMSGAPIGPGPGTEALGMTPSPQTDNLRAILTRSGSSDAQMLLAALDRNPQQ